MACVDTTSVSDLAGRRSQQVTNENNSTNVLVLRTILSKNILLTNVKEYLLTCSNSY